MPWASAVDERLEASRHGLALNGGNRHIDVGDAKRGHGKRLLLVVVVALLLLVVVVVLLLLILVFTIVIHVAPWVATFRHFQAGENVAQLVGVDHSSVDAAALATNWAATLLL